ncbi:MAG: hypothetical protein JWN25_54 [Verrucomicrobiales bacterium]|nr:hypothetical protein [Verrucomicrobiales bacterium]
MKNRIELLVYGARVGICIGILFASCGCQTFRASKEELPRGEKETDHEVGQVVEAVGTTLYFLALPIAFFVK